MVARAEVHQATKVVRAARNASEASASTLLGARKPFLGPSTPATFPTLTRMGTGTRTPIGVTRRAIAVAGGTATSSGVGTARTL